MSFDGGESCAQGQCSTCTPCPASASHAWCNIVRQRLDHRRGLEEARGKTIIHFEPSEPPWPQRANESGWGLVTNPPTHRPWVSGQLGSVHRQPSKLDTEYTRMSSEQWMLKAKNQTLRLHSTTPLFQPGSYPRVTDQFSFSQLCHPKSCVYLGAVSG